MTVHLYSNMHKWVYRQVNIFILFCQNAFPVAIRILPLIGSMKSVHLLYIQSKYLKACDGFYS